MIYKNYLLIGSLSAKTSVSLIAEDLKMTYKEENKHPK